MTFSIHSGCNRIGVAVRLSIAVAALMMPVTAANSGDSRAAFRSLQEGYVALDSGDWKAALEHYRRAGELAVGDEQRFNAAVGYGTAALELGRLDEARQAFENAHQLRPTETDATILLGIVCRRQGDLEAAVGHFADAAVRDPESVQALIELGVAYAELERHVDAERVCRRALEIDEDDVEARLGLAVALYHQDRVEEAVTEFRHVLELQPDNVRAHYGLGLALLYSGDRAGAMNELRYLNEHAPELGDELFKWIYPEL